METDARVFVAGGRGLVGSAIVRRLWLEGHRDVLAPPRIELALTDGRAVDDWFAVHEPDYVFLAAAKVGGIHANDTLRGDFIRENLLIQVNVIDAARRHGATKLQFLGSSCIYPRDCPQPIKEEYLLTGPLEATNQPYAIAKIAGIELCDAYRRQYGMDCTCLMPTNLYGPNDNFDLAHSHVLPAMIRRFHEATVAGAESVTLWGSGTPRREFLHVDDLADAAVHLMKTWSAPGIVNVGTGTDVTIRELAELVRATVGFAGNIEWNSAMPDGTPRKLLDVSRLTGLGWSARTTLREGLASTYRWFIDHHATAKGVATTVAG